MDGRTIGRESKKREPPPNRGVNQGNRPIRGVHGADDQDVLRQRELVSGIRERCGLFAVLEQEHQFTKNSCQIREVDFIHYENELFLGADIAVAERLRAHGLAGALLRDLSERRLATPVSMAHPELWSDCEPALRLARFDRAERFRIESAVARKLGRHAGTVISHFSRRKYFVGQPAALFPYTLFAPHEDLVPIEDVRKALATDKRPADYCEIFIAGT